MYAIQSLIMYNSQIETGTPVLFRLLIAIDNVITPHLHLKHPLVLNFYFRMVSKLLKALY